MGLVHTYVGTRACKEQHHLQDLICKILLARSWLILQSIDVELIMGIYCIDLLSLMLLIGAFPCFQQDDGEQLRLTEIGASLQNLLGGVWTERSVKLALAREGYIKTLVNIKPTTEDEDMALNFELRCQSFGMDQYIFVGEVASVSDSCNSTISRDTLSMLLSMSACTH